MTTYITNIGLLATPRGDSARRGRQQGEITLLRDAWVAVEGGKIAAVGQQGQPVPEAGDTLLDAGGRLMTPGLVDAHTHLIFGGWRQNELGQKLRGVPYLDILAQGGGILSTVRATRAASEEQLAHKAEAVLAEMLRMGVTTCEAKSGYGLEPEQEYKQLRVIRRLNETQPVELAATFMGAHALPEEYRERREDYIRLLCREMIPCAAREGLAEFCDVFCEEGVFTVRESRTILEAGLAHGLRPKVHADEIAAIGGSQLAGDIGAISAEHLIVCPPEGIRSLAAGGTVACCLPATSFYLGAAYAPGDDRGRSAGGGGHGLQSWVLPRQQSAAGHEHRVPEIPDDAGGGADGGDAECRRRHRPGRNHRLRGAGEAGGSAAVERAGPGLCVLSVRQQPGGHGDEEGTDRA